MLQVRDGEYEVLAGSDDDGDLVICEAGEFCGSFPVSGRPSLVSVFTSLRTENISSSVRRRESVGISSVSEGTRHFPVGKEIEYRIPVKILESRTSSRSE